MSSSTLIEVFGHILFSFTRGVTEHYNPQKPEYTAESFGYTPLESTGQEWYHHGDPDEECIYQEYSDREATTLDFIRSSRIDANLIDASLPEENREETQEDQQSRDRAWKRLRPSALRTVCKSMYIGALISLLTATIIGSIYILISYLYFKTASNCEFHLKTSIPVHVQWVRSISDAVACVFLYASFFVYILFLFRPYQLMGERKTDPGCLRRIFLGHNLSTGSTSPGNISFQAFYFAKYPTLCFVFYGCVLASLSSNETLPSSATDKKRSDSLFLTNNGSLRICYNSCHRWEMHYLPTLWQAK